MSTDLRALHDDLRTVARDLLAGPVSDRDGEATWRQAVDAGWTGLEVPDHLGGAGASFAEVAVVVEELGRAASPLPFLGPTVLAVGALLAVEPNDTRDELLAAVAAGRDRLAVALAPSPDALRPEPPFRIERGDAGTVLHGRAEMVLDAPVADLLLLLATDPTRRDQGVLVGVDPGAVTILEQPLLDHTRRVGTIEVAGVVVDDDRILPFAGDPDSITQGLVDRLAVGVAGDALGLAAAMLDATVAHVSQRRQFGRPVGSFQAVKHACADMHVQIGIGRELVQAAVDAVAAGAPDAAAAVSRAKSHVTAAAVDVVGSAMQLHGGLGYTWESGIHTYLKRAVLDRSLAGSPLDHRRRLATTLSSLERPEHRQERTRP